MPSTKKEFVNTVVDTVINCELSKNQAIADNIKENIFKENTVDYFIYCLNSIGACFWVDDYVNKSIHFLSPKLFEILGYDSDEVPSTFEVFFSMIHPDDRDNVTEKFTDYINGHRENYDAEFRLKRKAGGWLWTESLGFVSKSEDGKPIEMTGITIDISKRKELENLLHKTNSELERKNKLLEHLSFTDKLTGLFNRTKIDLVLDELINSEEVNNFGVALIDIDNFKGINDNFGHLTGDNVLKQFAQIISKNVPKDSVVGRWGGEEFIAIFNNLKKEELILFAENLREQICESEFEDVGKVTVSIGSSIHKNNEELRELFHRTDLALYEAKRNGKNRVEFS